jgi:HEAT repeat protein
MKNDPIEGALASLDVIPLRTAEGQKQMAKALAAKSNLVAAKAARIAGDALWTEMTEGLVAAFGRFLKRGAEADKGCVALKAIARALFNFDYDGAELYLDGMRHVQMEGQWGGSFDAAAELRAICAMGLANTRFPGKLRALVDLLADTEWQARAGAVRALAAVGSEAAVLLLRFKALSGDEEPEVVADCFSGLLSAEGGEAVSFVASFADSKDEEVNEAAILALGSSRRADAIEWLQAKYLLIADPARRKTILIALATSRTDGAFDFVIGLIRNGSRHTMEAALAAMAINRDDPSIQARVEAAMQARDNPSPR